MNSFLKNFYGFQKHSFVFDFVSEDLVAFSKLRFLFWRRSFVSKTWFHFQSCGFVLFPKPWFCFNPKTVVSFLEIWFRLLKLWFHFAIWFLSPVFFMTFLISFLKTYFCFQRLDFVSQVVVKFLKKRLRFLRHLWNVILVFKAVVSFPKFLSIFKDVVSFPNTVFIYNKFSFPRIWFYLRRDGFVYEEVISYLKPWFCLQGFIHEVVIVSFFKTCFFSDAIVSFTK